MGETAEHHMAHFVELPFGRIVEPWIVVAVYFAPPRRHAVDQFGAVGQCYHRSITSLYLVGRQRVYCRSIWMPEMLSVPGIVNCIIHFHSAKLAKLFLFD